MLNFIKEFIARPFEIGALVPSSHSLAREITSVETLGRASIIIEYGPGTGAFTGEIARRAKPDALIFTIEKNPNMAATMRRKFPEIETFQDTAANAQEILGKKRVEKVDCIISSLPWSLFTSQAQNRILESTLSILTSGGSFSTFVYLHAAFFPSARHFKELLMRNFANVQMSSIIWWNFPPAFVYHCRK